MITQLWQEERTNHVRPLTKDRATICAHFGDAPKMSRMITKCSSTKPVGQIVFPVCSSKPIFKNMAATLVPAPHPSCVFKLAGIPHTLYLSNCIISIQQRVSAIWLCSLKPHEIPPHVYGDYKSRAGRLITLHPHLSLEPKSQSPPVCPSIDILPYQPSSQSHLMSSITQCVSEHTSYPPEK